MKIIQNNHDSFEATCKHCKSVLRLEVEDLNGGDCEGFSFTCAACKRESSIKTYNIPNHILNMIER